MLGGDSNKCRWCDWMMSSRCNSKQAQSMRVLSSFPWSFSSTNQLSTLPNWKEDYHDVPVAQSDGWSFPFSSVTAVTLHCDHCLHPQSWEQDPPGIPPTIWVRCGGFTCCLQSFLFCECHSSGSTLALRLHQLHNLSHGCSDSQNKPRRPICIPCWCCPWSVPTNVSQTETHLPKQSPNLSPAINKKKKKTPSPNNLSAWSHSSWKLLS